jgi:hypothetical protein
VIAGSATRGTNNSSKGKIMARPSNKSVRKAARKRTRAKLTRNDKATEHLDHFTFNLSGNTRREEMEGRRYIVAPMVMMTEGVHHGSEGPLFYSGDVLGHTPAVWNSKPIVVYHPTINGQGVSACSKEVFESSKVGVIMNATFDGRLKAEAWIEEERLSVVDKGEDIRHALNTSTPMEVSTGVFTHTDGTPGEWNGETFNASVMSTGPDHLAFLPDQIGACSVADGAGLCVNSEGRLDMPELIRLASNAANESISRVFAAVTANGSMSFDQTQQSLRTAIYKRLGYDENSDAGPWVWIADVYATEFIYELAGQFYRLSYTTGESGVALSPDEPVEVMRQTNYVPVQPVIANSEKDVDMKDLVDKLIANTASGWTEKDRASLMTFSETQLKGLVANAEATPAADEDEDETPATPPAATPEPATAPATPEPNANAAPVTPQTTEQYIANAPPAIREMLSEGLTANNHIRTGLIKTITANEGNTFSPEALAEFSLGQLQAMAKLAAPTGNAVPDGSPQPAFSYAGANAGDAPTGNEEVVEPIATNKWEDD